MSTGFWKPAPVSSFRENRNSNAENEPSFYGTFSRTSAPIAQQRLLLPIYKHKKQILYALEKYSVVVIVGETGSGKSTQIPQYLVESGGWAGNDFQVVCTQPRRIAAISLAQRVALESGTRLGTRVGYAVRFDEQVSPTLTQIKFVTDGILLREATAVDPLLSSYSVVMVDEAHERNLNTDALMGLLKKIRRKRKNLRIIVCSATIDAKAFLDFFVGRTRKSASAEEEAGGTIISVDGRQYPVDILYLEKPAADYVKSAVETAHAIHSQQVGEEGGILVFLPSGEDIDRAIHIAEEEVFQHLLGDVDLLPLYGTLPYAMQARVFSDNHDHVSRQHTREGPSSRRRRIIFATNIAETSVTVPDVSHVIDSGLVKLPYFDPRTALDRLIVGAVSQASARQRAGRAGRVQPGKCYRLYTENFFLSEMQPSTPPEILRTNLSSLILTLKALGVDNILSFDMMDVPSVDALAHGLESLHALGAIDDLTRLTQRGTDMSAFPTDPRTSRMLLESLSSDCSWEILAIASIMQVERDVFMKPTSRNTQTMLDYESVMSEILDPSGDHVTYANLLSEVDDRDLNEKDCKERFINYMAVRRAMEVRQQLARFLRRFGKVRASGYLGDLEGRSKIIRKCVTSGYFANVAKLDNDGRYYTLRQKIPVSITSNSVLSSDSIISSEYIVFGETYDGRRGGIELRTVSAIEARWLRELAPHYWE